MENRLLALKVHANSLWGTQEGIPRLVNLLQQYQANATFFFSMGQDHTGRAMKALWYPSYYNKNFRSLVRKSYPMKALLYGTLLLGPLISKQCKKTMQSIVNKGFEVGLQANNVMEWQNKAREADYAWTKQTLLTAINTFEETFGFSPTLHSTVKEQMNSYAYRLEQRLGFVYASDTRGTHPFWPILQGEPIQCMQLPTTLPTLEELMGYQGLSAKEAGEAL